jgi:hypothetical protein
VVNYYRRLVCPDNILPVLQRPVLIL